MKILVWLILCLIWGTTWIFIKLGLRDLPPITFASARFVLASLIVFAIISIQKIPLPRSISEWRLLAITGFLQFAINYSTVFWGEQYITSGLAAVLQSMITVFGLVLAWIFLPHEKITRLKIFAVAIGIVGVAVIFIEQLRVESWMAFAGCVAIVSGSYCAAQASILVKARAGGIHPATLLFGQMVCGLPFILAYSFIVEGDPLSFRWSSLAVISVLYLTLVGTVAAFWLYYWLLHRIESTRAMMISLVTPLIAVLIGGIVLGERLPPTTFFGGLLIISSIGLIVIKVRSGSVIGRRSPEAEPDKI
jgi:drug/metabolite transporter (DMT)-like permease